MQLLVSFLQLSVGAIGSVFALPFIQPFLAQPGPSALSADGQAFALLSLFYFCSSIVLGIWGIVHFRSARWPLFALGGLYLFLFPLGTILGALTLIAVLTPAGEGAAGRIELRRIGGVLLAMGVVGPALVLGLPLLSSLNNARPPHEFDHLVFPAVLVFLVSPPLFVQQVDWSFLPIRTVVATGVWHQQNEARRRQEEFRITTLFADPATRPYAEAIRRGHYWSDEAIAYDRDPTMLVTGPAIQPIEAAMRRAGIEVRRDFASILTARCRIDEGRLYALFPPEGRYIYTDTCQYDRDCDPDEAVIFATSGMSYIHVIHPRSNADVPIFPAANR